MKHKRTLLPTLAALLVFTFFYGVILALNQNRNQQHRLHERNQVRETLNGRLQLRQSASPGAARFHLYHLAAGMAASS